MARIPDVSPVSRTRRTLFAVSGAVAFPAIKATRRARIAAMNGRTTDVARSVGLAGAVVNCAQRYRQVEGRVAASEDVLAERCRDLKDFRASSDADPPVRYVTPTARHEDVFGQPVAAVRGDGGWRVIYTVAADGFAVDVSPAEQLVHRWPRLRADGATEFGVLLSPEAARWPSRRSLISRRCRRASRAFPNWKIAYAPDTVAFSMRGPWSRWPSVYAPPGTPAESPNATLLSVLLPVGPNGATAEVVRYTVRFRLRDPSREPFSFDVSARATTPGLPSYVATYEGTMAPRAARTGDPIVK